VTIPVDIWLRGNDFATTHTIDVVANDPGAWTDDHVRQILEGMLRIMHQARHPDDPRAIALRGLSWIVNPFEAGGVVIAIEITMGAAIAGPIDIDKTALEGIISRVLSKERGERTVH
jgi:hypothetical protein